MQTIKERDVQTIKERDVQTVNRRMSHKLSRRLGMVLGSLVVLALPACAADPAEEVAQQPASEEANGDGQSEPEEQGEVTLTDVSVGLLFIGADAGMFVAQERGYFEDAGLNVEFQRFVSGGDQVPILSADQLDVASGSVTPGIYHSFAQGMGARIVGAKANLTPSFSDGGAIVARADLADSGEISSAADLAGKTVAVNNIRSTSLNYLLRPLEEVGLTREDVTVTELPLDQMIPALSNQAIDAAVLYPPLDAIAVQSGAAAQVEGTALTKTSPHDSANLMFFSPEFLETDASYDFFVAHGRGLRDYYEAVMLEQGDAEPIYEILAKYLERDVETVKLGLSSVPPNGEANVESLRQYQREWLEYGTQRQEIDVENYVDTSYVERLQEELGTAPE